MNEKQTAEEQKLKQIEQNVKLCRAVQAQRCVYDRENPCQKKECYDKAWETIAKECDDTVKSCKIRWRNIRFAFIRSLTPSSKKRYPNRTREYYLYEDLEFLIPHLASVADLNKTTDSEDDVLLVGKGMKKSILETTPNTLKKKMTNEDKNELTTSADETATDEQKTPTTCDKTKANKSSHQEKPSKVDDEIATDEQKTPITSDKTKANKSSILEKPSKVGTFTAAKVHDTEKLDEPEISLPTTSQAVAIDEKEKRDFRFRRACKRSLDKNVVQQLCDNSPTKKEFDSKRIRRCPTARKSMPKSETISAAKVKNKSPMKEVETPKKQQETEVNLTNSTEKKSPEKTLLFTLKSPDLPLPECQKFNYDLPVPIEPINLLTPTKNVFEPLVGTREQAVQCDAVPDIWDDEFLNTLRPQMAAMNSRQKLYFKQKVYHSLIDVFDNPANFPGPNNNTATTKMPPLFENAATGTEMVLIRELASMVQAAKSCPELTTHTKIKEVTDIATCNESLIKSNEIIEASTSAHADANRKTPTWRLADAARSHILHTKVIKTKSDGTYSTQDVSKPRIFRILNKPSNVVQQKTSNGGVGTFIIPRVPTSIASSVNAAAAAAELTEKNRGSPTTVYRQVAVPSSGAVLLSGSQAIAFQNSKPGVNRMMTVRSTIHPTGAGAPRQLVRRYSVCGAGDVANNKNGTTSAGTIPHLNLRRSAIVRATTATPPFKLPASVTQSSNIKTTPTTVQSAISSNSAPFTLTTSPVKIPIGAVSGMQSFSLNKSKTITPNIPPNPTKETEKPSQSPHSQTKDMPVFSVADTAGIIAADFASFNIKNEPME